MQNRLFVGNLSYSVTEDSLRDYFAQAGVVVSVKIITDKYSGRSKGFAFIEMETEKDAQKAMEMYDGKDFEGRALAVKPARPPREDGGAPAPDATATQDVPAASEEIATEEITVPEEAADTEEEKSEEEAPSEE